ncbi:MAG: leucine-rich repeat domain-containing protein, partial [Clostridia bacterium]|nr:leucine-rich repeat domain-containing protein [Clostridia bacterium]
MKKIIMFLSTVIMTLLLFTFGASALNTDRPYAESDTVKIIDNVVYALNEDGKSYYVEDYFATQEAAEKATEIKIVSEIGGIPVTMINVWKEDDLNLDSPRMESLPNIKKITVPEGIEEICVGAFSSLDGVKTVKLPSTVKKIWYAAFFKADSLEKVNIPSKVTVIERGMFQGCEKLKSVKIEGKVKTIESDAFYGCKALSKISLPK